MDTGAGSVWCAVPGAAGNTGAQVSDTPISPPVGVRPGAAWLDRVVFGDSQCARDQVDALAAGGQCQGPRITFPSLQLFGAILVRA